MPASASGLSALPRAAFAFHDLEVHAGARRLLGPLDLDVRRGECVGLVGESGSGKSLTAQALVGLLPAGLRMRGGLRVDGVDVAFGSPAHAALRGRKLAWMPQDPQATLHSLRRVGAQLRESLRVLQGLSANDAARAAFAWYERLGLPEPARIDRAYPHELSGGQRQRIALALALAGNPAVLVADEPTSALDPCRAAEMLALLDRLRAEDGLAVLLVSHDLPLVGAHAGRVAILHEGAIVEAGDTARVFAAPVHAFTRDLLARSGDDTFAPAADTAAATVLALDDVRIVHPGATTPAVAGATLRLARGQALAVVGESGSGKTSLGRAVLRLLRGRVDGRVTLDGEDWLAARGAHLRALRRRMGVVFQDPAASLDPRQRVADIVAEPLRIAGVDAATRRAAAARGLVEVGLDADALDRYPHQFSGGQRQRIALARALVAGPDLLVCDEAVSALDAVHRAGILALLAGLKRERGLALLFITHDLGAAQALAETIAVMQHGHIVEQGPTAIVLSTPSHPYTRALLAARPPPARYLGPANC
jgi:ABC-type microcin C transport system duplicated ATPase subunit YejF